MKRLSVALLCMTIALPAIAGDFLTMGCDYYNKGQYDKALAYLQAVTSKKPRLWQGHYYLANTYLALGQRAEATEEYQKARMCNPTPEVAAACDRILSQMAANAIRHGGMPSAKLNQFSQAHNDYINQQKQRIREQADNDAKRFLRDTDYLIDSGQSVAADKASLNPMAAPQLRERARELEQQTSQKIRQTYDEANDRARQLK